MNDSFDDELRRSLNSHADGVPRRPDLTEGAITRARGIRRRRQVAGVAAAAALVAIAVPIGLRVGDVMSGQEPIAPATTGPTPGPTETVPTPTPDGTVPTTPEQNPPTTPTDTDGTPQTDGATNGPDDSVEVTLDLQELPQGEAPAVPYLDGSTVVAYGNSIEVSGAVDGIAPVSDGVYVAAPWDAATGGWALTRYAADGSTQDPGTAQSWPVASADDPRWVAYTTGDTDRFGNPVGPATMVLVNDETGRSFEVELAGKSAEIQDVGAGTVYFTGSGYTAAQSWSAGDARPEPVAGDLDATAVSPDGSLVGRITRVVQDSEFCGAILNLATGQETPETCDTYYQIMGFSPGGEYAWAYNGEGYAASRVWILDTQTGEVLHEYTYASQRNSISFMDATFEDSDNLLIQAEQNGGTALVRCNVETGDCELAAPWAEGTSDPAGSSSPYRLGDVQ
jgi:hypothetical protein